jgi:hypothetical protein
LRSSSSSRAGDWLQHWRDCSVPLCRRRHACCGQHPCDCYYRQWDDYGPEAQAWIEAGFRALEDGATARRAMRYADVALLSFVKRQYGLPVYAARKGWRWVKLDRIS